LAERESGSLNELLPWQQDLWARMWSAVDAGRLPHAFLIHGPSGLGKEHFARMFAEGLLCRNAQQGRACGACDSCILLRAGSHPDLHCCEPENSDGNSDREKGSIGVDQIRALCHFLSLTPHQRRRKIVIMPAAHRMNINAANALLKTLEEPPETGLLLLVTEHPSRLPATVLSRCQRLRCSPPATDVAEAWLAQRCPKGTDPRLLLALAGGSPLAAADLIGKAEGLERRDAMLTELEALAAGRSDPVTIAAAWLKFGARESLYWLYHWLADMLRLDAGLAPTHIAGTASEARVRNLARAVPADELHRALQLTEKSLRLVEGQSNAQLLLEDVLIVWSTAAGRAAPR
jgi:DNA polymerase-3 subunit delta'